MDFEKYLKQYPNSFSWKNVAEVLYRCGEEKYLDKLVTYMKSPEGKFRVYDLFTYYAFPKAYSAPRHKLRVALFRTY